MERVPSVYELAGWIAASKIAHLHPRSVEQFMDVITEEALAGARLLAPKLEEAAFQDILKKV